VPARGQHQGRPRAATTKNIFHNIPPPMETAALLKKAGAEYDKDILNDVKHVDDYTSASKQALNLGIYGADLSYASVYNNTQESMLYTSCARNWPRPSRCDNAFNEQVVWSVMEQNRNDRDSLLRHHQRDLLEVDGLSEGERSRQHQRADDRRRLGGRPVHRYARSAQHDTPELRQRIAEQKLPLIDLLELVKTYSPDDPAVASVQTDLEKLTDLFKDVVTPTGAATVTQENGVAVIGGGAPTAALTDAQTEIHP
jgi:hypothetical protein